MTYTAQPGTIPARAIALLRANPPGAMFASSVLADMLDVEPSSLSAVLAYPAKQGALVVEKRLGINYWGLGNGSPETAVPGPEEADDAPIVQRVVEVRLPPTEDRLAAEALERIGFPVPNGKHTIAAGTLLYVRGTRGRGSFVLRYTSPSGKRREMGLSAFIANTREHAIAAIANALRSAEQKQAMLLAGIDPLDEKGPAAARPAGIKRPAAGVRKPAAVEPAQAGGGGQEASSRGAPAQEVRHAPLAAPDWQLRLNELGRISEPPRFAIWSDGSLSVERAGQRLEFTAEETRALCTYLDKILVGGTEA